MHNNIVYVLIQYNTLVWKSWVDTRFIIIIIIAYVYIHIYIHFHNIFHTYNYIGYIYVIIIQLI